MNYDTRWWQRLLWHTATRWYMVELSQDMFGKWVMEQSWGERSCRNGTSRKVYFDSWADANKALLSTMSRRAAKGYYFVQPQNWAARAV